MQSSLIISFCGIGSAKGMSSLSWPTLSIRPSEGTPIGGAHQVAQCQHIDRLTEIQLFTRGS